jgi:hypothetical protein
MPHTPKSISPARLEANRSNAARSTGPRTPEGKARSAQNSRKHGFTASNFAIVRIEELDAIANLKADLVALYQPVNSQELFAVERIALAQQSLLRVAALESGLFTNCLDQALEPAGTPPILRNPEITEGIEITGGQNHNYWLANGFHLLAAKSNCWPLLLRYQAQTERLYRRAVEEFERLRSLRSELPDEIPNEPAIQPEPEDTKPVPLPETKPVGQASEPVVGLTSGSAQEPRKLPPRRRPPPPAAYPVERRSPRLTAEFSARPGPASLATTLADPPGRPAPLPRNPTGG